MQAFVVRTIGSLRRQTALKTDARVKFASEFIQGALAMKMLSWEKPFFEAIRTIRYAVSERSELSLHVWVMTHYWCLSDQC